MNPIDRLQALSPVCKMLLTGCKTPLTSCKTLLTVCVNRRCSRIVRGQSVVKTELVLSAMEEVSDLYTPAADTYLLFCHLPCATTTSVCCSTCISADL